MINYVLQKVKGFSKFLPDQRNFYIRKALCVICKVLFLYHSATLYITVMPL